MKKFLALTLAAMLILSLAACGGANQASDGGTSSASEEPSTTPSEVTTPEEENPASDVIALECGDSIDNESFSMTFDSIEILPEYSYSTGEYISTSLYVEDGYKLLMVKGHFENKSTAAISGYDFVRSAVVNDSYELDSSDVRMDFLRANSSEIDPYTDRDYILYANIPDKLADMFETATFTIGFNDDMSTPHHVFVNGKETVETDHVYALTGGVSSGAMI